MRTRDDAQRSWAAPGQLRRRRAPVRECYTLQEARQQIQVQPSVCSCTNVLSLIISLSGGAQRSQGQCTMVGELARDRRYAVQRVTHETLLRGSL